MNKKTRHINLSSIWHSRIVYLTFTAASIAVSCMNANAESSVPKQPPLFLTADAVPKKGYIEKDRKIEGKVAFRVCATAELIPVEEKSLKPVQGTCLEPTRPWSGFTGAIVTIGTDGSLQIKTLDGQTFALSAEDWRKGFLAQPQNSNITPPQPKIGDYIAGVIRDTSSSLYIVRE